LATLQQHYKKMSHLFLTTLLVPILFATAQFDATPGGVPELNKVESCYSTKELVKGLCKVDADCADDTERCYTQVCIAKHTVQKTSYRAGTIDTIIAKWPPLNANNKMPLMELCEPEYSAGCYITRYIDWPPGTNTHLRTTDNAGFRGGCTKGYYEMDSQLRLPEGCMVHLDGTRTISCFCSNEDDCNMAWQGTYLEMGEAYKAGTNSSDPNGGAALRGSFGSFLLLTISISISLLSGVF